MMRQLSRNTFLLVSGIFLGVLLMPPQATDAAAPARTSERKLALCKAVSARWHDTNALIEAYSGLPVPGLRFQSIAEESGAIHIEGSADSEELARELKNARSGSGLVQFSATLILYAEK